jgi:hypothetical protein
MAVDRRKSQELVMRRAIAPLGECRDRGEFSPALFPKKCNN